MTTIESLAYGIVSDALKLSTLLREGDIQSPSFRPESASDFDTLRQKVSPDLERQIHAARNGLVDKANDIALLAKGPTDTLLGLAWASADTSNLTVIARFNIPSLIPLSSPQPLSTIVAATNLSPDILSRTLRYAVANGIFTEPIPNVFGHNALSARLLDPSIRNIIAFSGQELSTWLTQQSETLRLQTLKGDQGPHAALNVAAPAYSDAFDFFHNEKEANERYHAYLEGRTKTGRWSEDTFVGGWEWGNLGRGVVVDCGGSIGHSCTALATSKCPETTFIVQDMNKDALQRGSEMIKADPALGNRIQFLEHDFFTVQKVVADVYLFRHILHDWSDADSVKIIKALVPALRKGARVLIAEGLMPPPPAKRSSTLDAKNVRIEDLFMMAAHDAKERTAQEFEAIFKQASPMFKFVGVSGGGAGSFQSIIEFQWEGVDKINGQFEGMNRHREAGPIIEQGTGWELPREHALNRAWRARVIETRVL